MLQNVFLTIFPQSSSLFLHFLSRSHFTSASSRSLFVPPAVFSIQSALLLSPSMSQSRVSESHYGNSFFFPLWPAPSFPLLAKLPGSFPCKVFVILCLIPCPCCWGSACTSSLASPQLPFRAGLQPIIAIDIDRKICSCLYLRKKYTVQFI